MQRGNGRPLDGSSSVSIPTIVQKSDTRHGSSEVASVWNINQLQEACCEIAPPGHKEEVIEGKYAIPLILQDDELLEGQQGTISASTIDDVAHTVDCHDELMYDPVAPLS
jgi:hypothetical protein